MATNDRIMVPLELDRAARRRFASVHCALCDVPLGGGRAVASTSDREALENDRDKRPLWVAHHGCYVEAFRRALRANPELAVMASEEQAHEAFRNALTNRVMQTAGVTPLSMN